jgi:hypothetical protein
METSQGRRPRVEIVGTGFPVPLSYKEGPRSAPCPRAIVPPPLMPQPKHPDRYPAEFRTVFERAHAGETIEIPSANPSSLRARLYGFARALRGHDQQELADAVQINTRKGVVVVESRANSASAKEVRAALEQIGENPSPVADSLLERLTQC